MFVYFFRFVRETGYRVIAAVISIPGVCTTCTCSVPPRIKRKGRGEGIEHLEKLFMPWHIHC